MLNQHISDHSVHKKKWHVFFFFKHFDNLCKKFMKLVWQSSGKSWHLGKLKPYFLMLENICMYNYYTCTFVFAIFCFHGNKKMSFARKRNIEVLRTYCFDAFSSVKWLLSSCSCIDICESKFQFLKIVFLYGVFCQKLGIEFYFAGRSAVC